MQLRWTLEYYVSPPELVTFSFDASPWGLGGIVTERATITGFFRPRLTAVDEGRFGHRIGDNKGQQTWELLSALVGLRIWSSKWAGLVDAAASASAGTTWVRRWR